MSSRPHRQGPPTFASHERARGRDPHRRCLMLRQSHVRRRQYAVGLAAVSMATVAGCGSDALPEANRAAKSTPAATPTESAPGTFVSDTLPYRLKLLHGWSVG